jgi:hypothetical protein
MNVPTEILSQIASYLDAKDLRRFRSTNRQCAKVGVSFIARNGLSALNTAAGLQEIRQLLQCKSIAISTRQLTINHSRWPICTRKEWERHPLLFSGPWRFESLETSKANKAFAAYSAFIAKEQNRSHDKDVSITTQILNLLPNLQSLVISHMKVCSWHPSHNTKYKNLLREIWMTPYIDVVVTPAVQISLLALGNGFSNITSFTIHGIFDPTELGRCSELKFPNITKLCITTLQIKENKDMIHAFLR